jgi:hypothetical protein
MHEPILTFDTNQFRFVLLYVNRTTSNNTANDELMTMTSTDGVNWTAPQQLNLWAIDAPDMSCGAGLNPQCTIQYSSGIDPQPYFRAPQHDQWVKI